MCVSMLNTFIGLTPQSQEVRYGFESHQFQKCIIRLNVQIQPFSLVPLFLFCSSTHLIVVMLAEAHAILEQGQQGKIVLQ